MPTENYSLEFICKIARKWIQGDSLKRMIVDQIRWNSEYATRNDKKPASVNKSVRDINTVINSDIRFRLSNALRCYQVLLENVLQDADLDIVNVKLHSYIEIGACDDRLISLINIGLSREAALDIDDSLSGDDPINGYNDLMAVFNAGKLSGIHPVTEKELVGLIG